jgi:hypothetical protein
MRIWISIAATVLVLGLTACGTDDSGGESPTAPTLPRETAQAAVEPFADDEATSRRLDVAVTVPDSGLGVAHVELWARPGGGEWSLDQLVEGEEPVRVTLPADGPFGRWEFAAVAVPTGGAPVDTLGAAEAGIDVPAPITITDNHGEVWEITHAVKRYGMSVPGWEEGMGRHTLRPIIDPALSSEGDPDYLPPDNLAVVLGLVVGGEARAYKLGDLPDVEVVDDTIQGTHLAVTY